MKADRAVGILGWGAYVPRLRVRTADISAAWRPQGAAAPAVAEKSVPGPDEDVVTMSIEAARTALDRSGAAPDAIGAVWVGTESKPWRSRNRNASRDGHPAHSGARRAGGISGLRVQVPPGAGALPRAVAVGPSKDDTIPRLDEASMSDEIAEQQVRWLSEVKLERFKAAFRPKPIPLFPFTVVIGRNGSGKSTLLEALQWLDTTIRTDARAASDRYFGAFDLVNLRSQNLFFQLTLTWSSEDPASLPLRYNVRVDVEEETGAPRISKEELVSLGARKLGAAYYLQTSQRGERFLTPSGNGVRVTFREPDRLALGLLGPASEGRSRPELSFLEQFWTRAVFLRLSPNRLAHGSPATRKSFEPLLDEEGQNLPALLNELAKEQREDLVAAIREILPGIRGVEVSKADLGRDTRVNYSLLERMPYKGRAGRGEFPIPSWMLSEGTRRITAIMALLAREPAPSLLCIEEIENGLDPWTVLAVLRHLRSAANRGTQVIVTTHSPWILDSVPIDSILQVRRIEGDTQYDPFASRPEIKAYDPSVPAGTRYVNEAE